jgi:hypothetical protein
MKPNVEEAMRETAAAEMDFDLIKSALELRRPQNAYGVYSERYPILERIAVIRNACDRIAKRIAGARDWPGPADYDEG